MELFLRIDINIVAFIVLGAILLTALKRLDKQDPLNQSFFRVIIIVLLQLIFETGTCIINGRIELWLIPITYFLHMCLYITGTILAYNGLLLVRHFLVPNKAMQKQNVILLRIPMIINAILVIFSPIFHLIFYIDKSNTYQRGNYFTISIIIIYMYIFLMIRMIIINRKKIGDNELISLLAFSFFPMIGGIVQALFYGTLLMWSSTAFALVIMYSYLQQRMVQLDYLTGVWSRGSFEFYIKNRLTQKNNNKLGIIYCDVDGLKNINDQYGHREGDYAIRTTTKIIRKAIRKTDIIVRMGGDEFIIVLECDSPNVLLETLEKIEMAYSRYNINSSKSYKLSCSFGADVLTPDYNNIEQFLHHVDCLMYRNKKAKKDNKR